MELILRLFETMTTEDKAVIRERIADFIAWKRAEYDRLIEQIRHDRENGGDYREGLTDREVAISDLVNEVIGDRPMRASEIAELMTEADDKRWRGMQISKTLESMHAAGVIGRVEVSNPPPKTGRYMYYRIEV